MSDIQISNNYPVLQITWKEYDILLKHKKGFYLGYFNRNFENTNSRLVELKFKSDFSQNFAWMKVNEIQEILANKQAKVIILRRPKVEPDLCSLETQEELGLI